MTKIGIIRCQQTEDICPGTSDFKALEGRKFAFSDLENPQLVGFVSCGGCPGKRAVARAKKLEERGAEYIFLASCMGKGNPIGMPCPHFAALRQAIVRKVGDTVTVVDWTHD